jgi:transcriptional regulator with XRE-family HTH domain
MRYNNTSSAMLAVLRRHLRREGWTARRIAAEFGIGEATAKRWLAGKGLTLERLERLAALVGVTFGDLSREAERPGSDLAQELTLAQERALSSDAFLSFLFMTVLGGDPPDEIARDFAIPGAFIDAQLLRLERLALIDRLPGGRVRPRVDRTIVWRKGPMRALFEAQMKPQFMAMDFAAEDSVYASEAVKLSARGAAELGEAIETFRRQVQALAERDRDESLLPRRWHGMLCVMRVLDVSALEGTGRQ